MTEESWADDHQRGARYHRSKIEQERVALAAQIPTVLVLPSTPVGRGDRKPTPTGKMIVDFMKGRVFATLPGGLNVVPVEDVARAHILALQKGRPGQRYLAGGSNLSLAELFEILAQICCRPRPRFRIPHVAALGLALVDEARCRLISSAEPVVPLEGVQMGRELMYVSSAKAEAELGYTTGSVTDALRRSVDWFRDHGYAR